MDVTLTGTTVEIFYRGHRVASHRRSHRRGQHTTVTQHMPASHRNRLQWSPARLQRWAGTLGPFTRRLVTAILSERPHLEQGYRSCLGILRLARRYAPARLEAACERAVAIKARSYRSVASILKSGLDRVPLAEPMRPAASPRFATRTSAGWPTTTEDGGVTMLNEPTLEKLRC